MIESDEMEYLRGIAKDNGYEDLEYIYVYARSFHNVLATIARLTAELAAALKRAEAAEQSESGLARALTTAMAELVALREQTRWIPVSERLPRQEQRTLIRLPKNLTTTGLFIKVYSDFDRGIEEYYWMPDSGGYTNLVTHWMQIPEADNE
jgi:transcription initiation factor IIE alpha subunit